MTFSKIVQNFDAAAGDYDRAAKLQSDIAQMLVDWAFKSLTSPTSILDIGSGTGLVCEALHRKWPAAVLTALDASPAMLRIARQKIPNLKTITADATLATPDARYDTLFSSMALHWLSNPIDAIRHWQKWLKPDGKLFAAVPVEGSFQEWRDLAGQFGLQEKLWPLPKPDFANDIARQTMLKEVTVNYASAHDFLRSIKLTGASTSRVSPTNVDAVRLRKLLRSPQKPIQITYRLAFLEIPE